MNEPPCIPIAFSDSPEALDINFYLVLRFARRRWTQLENQTYEDRIRCCREGSGTVELPLLRNHRGTSDENPCKMSPG